ncbi:zinc finger and BTB domain-containing protein 8A-like [Sitophilus oryzae]|uniref:Zinc finger and BTB domain-containing protein 8A-like n=1 Tax=Sitophilus oryzae TaxID=7048 RepID=A0A6J2XM10_SITOR|nr:zinc finger and BTB domain-containing protein 8A-like [Sitophilus oryzae]
MKSPQTKSIRLLQEKYEENRDLMFQNLLADDVLSDVTFHCRDGFVKAHKVILAAASPYFKKVFAVHSEPKTAYILHGVTVGQMKSFMELVYRGVTDISSDMITKLCQVATEFGITGIVDTSMSDTSDKSISPGGRDTRLRGQKRVAVDFREETENLKIPEIVIPIKRIEFERRPSTCSEKSKKSDSPLSPLPSAVPISESSFTSPAKEIHSPESITLRTLAQRSAAARRSGQGGSGGSNWAMKLRKFKCDLCPASFNRASTLSRHQLVHTGERPYACSQCDKAFSRLDKLKNHIKRVHDGFDNENLQSGNFPFTLGHVKVQTSESDEIMEDPPVVRWEDLAPRKPTVCAPSTTDNITKMPKKEAEHIVSINVSKTSISGSGAPQKKARGRPRKSPPVPRPLVKRPRGRQRSKNKSSPSASPVTTPVPKIIAAPENYDITNMPFGDLEYLTKSLCEPNNEQIENTSNLTMEAGVMEPFVEINLDQSDSNDGQNHTSDGGSQNPGNFLKKIGLLETNSVSTIGNCTISVASSSQKS